ncbi:MAG: hypothetical protein EXS08_00190 [Planctomycetes bacterium]|nr:hypothetical protein [Planctomycetota bacterium]
MAPDGDLTGLLRQAKGGDREAQAKVFEQVYDELRAAARRIGSGPGATLQPTALVHEAWLKLAPGLDAVNDRVHFFAVASLAMRQVVANHARAARREKRGGGLRAVSLDDSVHLEPGSHDRSPAADLCALDECLEAAAVRGRGIDRARELGQGRAAGPGRSCGGATALDLGRGRIGRSGALRARRVARGAAGRPGLPRSGRHPAAHVRGRLAHRPGGAVRRGAHRTSLVRAGISFPTP